MQFLVFVLRFLMVIPGVRGPCKTDIHVWKWNRAKRCDAGYDGRCNNDPNVLPQTISAGSRSNGGRIQEWRLETTNSADWAHWKDWTIRFKIYRELDLKKNYMEFRYTTRDDIGPDKGLLRWSLIDEKGIFKNEKVKVTPNPMSSIGGDCQIIRCEKDQNWCNQGRERKVEEFVHCRFEPGTESIMWLDICEPKRFFNNRRRVYVDDGTTMMANESSIADWTGEQINVFQLRAMILALSNLSLAAAITVIISTATVLPLPVATAPTVANKIWVNNWCPYKISICEQTSGQCDIGASGTCSDVPGSKPWEAQPSSATGHGMATSIDWLRLDIWDKLAHFIKIFREADRAANASAHLEFAYSLSFDNRLR
ncbi:hypothetical protein DL98DRAFT_583199 [Cadophora sp. DSE1049]|nr:hypothetical protein DL98DRAFT_583199 [Cadophora sp. DSE1049]